MYKFKNKNDNLNEIWTIFNRLIKPLCFVKVANLTAGRCFGDPELLGT